MKVSRRDFVSTASCAAVASLCALPSPAFAAKVSDARFGRGCMLLDLKANCTLPESFDGMRAALGYAHRCVTESEFASIEFSARGLAQDDMGDILIVAGAGLAQAETFRSVANFLERGATVLWESGAAFLEPSEFVAQQGLVRDYFGICVERPLDVWSQTNKRKLITAVPNQNFRSVRAIGHEQIPYVAYQWPREAYVRDFSRVIPVHAATGRAIAHWGKIPVAWRKSAGHGALVFVGSPIGPALRSGDSEAHSLVHSIVTT